MGMMGVIGMIGNNVMVGKSFKDLNIYNGAFEVCLEVHQISLKLPKYELYELGSQIRRSAQSIRANIVEGWGRRHYAADYAKFLVHAHASLLETISHLEMIMKLYQLDGIPELLMKLEKLGSQIFNYINYVRNNWKT